MISPMCKKLVAPRISPIFVLVFMSIYDNRIQMLITATLENSLPHGGGINIPTEILEMRNLLIIKQTSELLEI